MKKLLVCFYIFIFYSETMASELYCEFTVYGLAPFIETATSLTDGMLGSEVNVTHQGQTQTYPLVLEKTVSGEKFKFTIADGNPEGEVYVTVFEDAGDVPDSFKAQVTNPAITVPIGKDLPGFCVIRE